MSTPRGAGAAPLDVGGVAARVAQVHAELMRLTRKRLDEQGIALNHSQVQALKRLRAHGSMSAGELARAFDSDSGGMTRLLDRRESQGLLQRQPAPDDRRSLRIQPTAAGLALGERLAAIGEAVLAQALSPLSARERQGLLDALERLLAALRQAP